MAKIMVFLLLIISVTTSLARTLIVVDQHGRGDFTTVQNAVDAVPTGNSRRITIFVSPGTYIEKVRIPDDKPYITLQGGGYELTTIVWDDFAQENNSVGHVGALHSASVIVAADNFIARSVTFKNNMQGGEDHGVAAAVRISGDKAAFYDCKFISTQGTLYDHNGRHYFKDCYIEGVKDVIFGAGTSIYKNCEIHIGGGPETVSSQMYLSATQKCDSGFAFVESKIIANGPLYFKNLRGIFPRVIFLSSYIQGSFIPLEMAQSFTCIGTVFYGQYNCSGPAISGMAYCYNLTESEARPFMDGSFINGEQWIQDL